MAISIMNRCEQKYYVNSDKYQKLLEHINQFVKKDPYFREKICNVYFDNDDNELITRSLDKPIYKEKIRLRSYDVPNDNSICFLEIKKKYGDIVNKRRIEITYKEAKDYIYKGIIPNANKQIMNEIDYCFKNYNLKPKIGLCYDRDSYYAIDDSSFRITFDYNIKGDFNNATLSDSGTLLFNDGVIMEIKTLKGIPKWFNDCLSQLEIYPRSYSKVGVAYTKLKESGCYV